jgi:hypothetical protein
VNVKEQLLGVPVEDGREKKGGEYDRTLICTFTYEKNIINPFKKFVATFSKERSKGRVTERLNMIKYIIYVQKYNETPHFVQLLYIIIKIIFKKGIICQMIYVVFIPQICMCVIKAHQTTFGV